MSSQSRNASVAPRPVRRAIHFVTAAALAALSVPLFSSPASAVIVGGFEVDGNQLTESALDWQALQAQGKVSKVSDPVGNSDASTFDGGDSEGDNDGVNPESPWGVGSPGTPSGKSDIGNVLVADYKADGDPDTYVAFAWDRAGDTGTGRYYIELNQAAPSGVTPNRTNGDVRIIVAINGSDLLVCQSVQTWSGSWTNSQACGSAFQIVVNNGAVDDLFNSPNAPLEANTFLEGVLNLSDFGLNTCPVSGFQSIHFRSQEGGENGDTSALKDFATGPIDIPSDCGSLTINKTISGSGTPDATFMITPDPTPGSNAAYLIVTTGDDGTVKVTAEPGDYTVTELAPPTGYLLPDDNVEGPVSIGLGQHKSVSFSDVLGSIRFTKGYEGHDPQVGATFSITRIKQWSFDTTPPIGDPVLVDASGPTIEVTDNGANDADGDIGEIKVTPLFAGKYEIVELSAPDGWIKDPGNSPKQFTVGPTDAEADRHISLNADANPPTFNNLLRPIAIKIIKTESVPGVPDDLALLKGVTFRLYVYDGEGGCDTSEDALVSAIPTNDDGEILWSGLNWQKDYCLEEVKKDGYGIGLTPNPKFIDINQATPPTTNDVVITVPVDNPREEVDITLTKVDGSDNSVLLNGGTFQIWRDNGNGLFSAQDDYLLGSEAAVNGDVTFSSAEYQLPWGYTYFVYESQAPDGYQLMTPNPITVVTDVDDAEQTIDLGMVEDPQLPTTLTLVKIVDNGETDGTATVADFPLTADGPGVDSDMVDVISGTDEASELVAPATYALSEGTGPVGYTASAWSCEGNEDSGADGAITMGMGDTVTCTITNTAQPGTYEYEKSSDPVTGSTVEPGDEVTYTVTVTKTGGVDSTNVLIEDDLSDVFDNATLVPGSIVASTGVAQIVGSKLSWTIPTLSDVETVSYTVLVTEGEYGETLHNVVTSPEGECASVCDTTHYTPHWTLTKTSDPVEGSTVMPGTDVVYTLTVHNDSDAVVEGATVTDDLTNVLDNAELVLPLANGLSIVSNTLTWAMPTLQPDESAQISYTVTIGANEWDQTLDNVATPGQPSGECLEVGACETDHETPPLPILTLVKIVDNGETDGTATVADFPLTADGPGESDIVDAISGTEAATEQVLPGTYVLSESTELEGYEGSSWSCVGNNDNGADGSVVLEPADEVTCTVTNTAQPGTYEYEKSSDPASGATVEPGDVVTYTVTVTKTGGVDSTNVLIVDDLSDVFDNATLVPGSIVASSGVAEINGSSLSWTIPTLSDVETVTYSVVVNADEYGETLHNVVTSPEGECASVCDTTHYTPHWTLTKTSDPVEGSTVMPGTDVVYTLTVHNDSDAVVEGATVTDDLTNVLDNAELVLPLANGLSIVSTTLTWAMPTLQPDESAQISYTVTIGADEWGEALDNVATPGQPSGECLEEGACETDHNIPPVTTLVVEKVNFETGEALAGATFQLWDDNEPYFNADGIAGNEDDVVGPEDTAHGDPVVSGDDGLVKWSTLLAGLHLIVEETVAPEGYGLPEHPLMGVTLSEGVFVPMGEMAVIQFRDPALGQIAILAKRQYRLVGNEWTEFTGEVRFGEPIRYEVDVQATGEKLFHNVTVTDYVPGYNPDDTTSTAKATYEAGSGECLIVVCAVSFDPATGLVTWEAGTISAQTFTTAFVVTFPESPSPVPYDANGHYEDTIWNVAYLDWDEVPVTGDTEGLVHFTLTSNEVVAAASLDTLPEELPETGASMSVEMGGLLGSALVVLGAWLMLASNRRRKVTS